MTARRALRLAPLAALLALGAAPAVAGKAPTGKPAAEVRHPEDLFIVDCLLPGKVRSLGRYNKIATPRKVVRTSAHECGLRGGEWSQDLQDNASALQSWQAQADAGDAEAMKKTPPPGFKRVRRDKLIQEHVHDSYKSQRKPAEPTKE